MCNLLKSPQFFSEQNTDQQQEQFDISEQLLQAKLQNLAKRIKTCSENSVTFAADISDLMNRLISRDAMVTGELQVVEANLDLVTDYDGNLLEPMTTPNAQLEKVNCSFYFLELAPVAFIGIASRNLGIAHLDIDVEQFLFNCNSC